MEYTILYFISFVNLFVPSKFFYYTRRYIMQIKNINLINKIMSTLILVKNDLDNISNMINNFLFANISAVVNKKSIGLFCTIV